MSAKFTAFTVFTLFTSYTRFTGGSFSSAVTRTDHVLAVGSGHGKSMDFPRCAFPASVDVDWLGSFFDVVNMEVYHG